MTEEAGSDPTRPAPRAWLGLLGPGPRSARTGVAFSGSPESVFLAYRRSGVQIEVYDPTPGRARDLVTSHQVTAVRPR